MGALGNTGDGRIFINTFKGRFTKKVDATTTGSIKRINKNSVEVNELHFDTISDCLLQKIEKYKSEEYGFQWNIYLAHTKSDETFKVSLPFSGRMTMGFFLRLPNIDISKEMTFIIYYYPKDNKVALVVYQFNKKVPVYWTEESPGDLPKLEPTIRDGKDSWDSTKRMIYMEKYMDSQIHPFLKMDNPPPAQSNGAMANQLPVEMPKNTTTTQAGAVSQPETVTKPAEVQTPPPVEKQIPVWDQEAGYLKNLHTDGNWYQCNDKGVFKRDNDGKMLGALPF